MGDNACRHGVKSIEVGTRLLRALVGADRSLCLKELAGAAGMTSSKAHRYLLSYIEAGLVVQDAATRRYDIGPFAVEFGLAGIGRSDFLSKAEICQRELRDSLDLTVVQSVWGAHGPMVLRVEESSMPVVMTMRVGGRLPLFHTAAGWVFATFMPHRMVEPVIQAEFGEHWPTGRLKQAEIEARIAQVRSAHMAFNKGDLLAGIHAIAAPLLNLHGQLVSVLSVIGREHEVPFAPDGKMAATLRETSERFSTG